MLDKTQVWGALGEVATLVQSDGSDIQLVSLDPDRSAVGLRTVVEGAKCADRVLPGPMLEDMAAPSSIGPWPTSGPFR